MGALVDKSILTASFPDGEPRYDLLDTVRDYAVEQLAKAGALGPTQLAHANTATMADAARVDCGPTGWTDQRLELEHDNLWAALAYARDAHDAAIAVGWGQDRRVFPARRAHLRGPQLLEAALASMSSDVPLSKRIELLAFLCYLATEELDLDAAIDLGQSALAVAATGTARSESALAQ